MGNWTISEINGVIKELSDSQKRALIDAVLKVNDRSIPQNFLKTAILSIIKHSQLGFYAEILSYTTVSIGEGTFYTPGNVTLTREVFNGKNLDMTRDILMHELLHSFNYANKGPEGSLNEGSAVWIYKMSFPETRSADELAGGWAETVYGSKNYYRDIIIQGYPTNLPLEVLTHPTPKLLELYNLLSNNDPSRLPWNSNSKLVNCYNKYWQGISRKTDDMNLWFKKAAETSKVMSRDINCNPD